MAVIERLGGCCYGEPISLTLCITEVQMKSGLKKSASLERKKKAESKP